MLELEDIFVELLLWCLVVVDAVDANLFKVVVHFKCFNGIAIIVSMLVGNALVDHPRNRVKRRSIHQLHQCLTCLLALDLIQRTAGIDLYSKQLCM